MYIHIHIYIYIDVTIQKCVYQITRASLIHTSSVNMGDVLIKDHIKNGWYKSTPQDPEKRDISCPRI